MDERVSLTVLVMNELGGLNIEQPYYKKHGLIYLAQSLAFELGYRHSWHGFPYSETLEETASEYFSNKEEYDQEIKRMNLKELSKHKLIQVVEFITPPHENISEVKWIDILSSTHYFKNICFNSIRTYEGIPLNMTNTFLNLDENRTKVIKDHGRKFSLEEFKLAWKCLEQYGLLDKKHNRSN
jgi:hypothetical protein